MKTHGIGTEPVSARTCPNCGKVFKYATLCKVHVKRTCKNKTKCDRCDISFQNKSELKYHIRSSHDQDNLKCNFCDFVASSIKFRKTHEKGVHLNLKCKVSKKLFHSHLEREQHACAEPGPFQCDECEKNYTTKSALQHHIQSLHRGLRFPCSVCTDVLSTKYALERHVHNMHGSDRKFKCDMCGCAFEDEEYLIRHEKLHTEQEKTAPCAQCGIVLANPRALQIHVKRVHERTIKHTGEDCGETFPYLNALQIQAEMAHMKGALHVRQV